MDSRAPWMALIGAMLALCVRSLSAMAQPAAGTPAAALSAPLHSPGAQPAGTLSAPSQPPGAQSASPQPAGPQAPASPQAPAAPRAGAKALSALKAEGAAAAAARQYERCARAYEAALGLEADQVVAGELGLCEMSLGRFVAAHDHLLEALTGEAAERDERSHGIRTRYRQAFWVVTDRLARVIVTVRPSRAEVFLDGVSLGTSASGRYFAVTPGSHVWTARLEGYEDDTLVQVGRGGDLPNVDLVLKPLPTPAPVPAPKAIASAVIVPAPAPPCGGPRGVRISPAICRLVDELNRGSMEPTLLFIAGALMSAGFTADVGPGFWLGGEARWREEEDLGVSLGAEVRTLLPTKGGVRTNDKPLEISLIALGFVPCARYRWVSGCVVIDPGLSIAGGPPPLTFPSTPVLFMLGIGPRLAVDIAIVERVGLRAFADLRFSPLRSDLGYIDSGVAVWIHPPVSGVFGVGVWFK